MVAGRRQAMDSAPVKANASMDSLQKKKCWMMVMIILMN